MELLHDHLPTRAYVYQLTPANIFPANFEATQYQRSVRVLKNINQAIGAMVRHDGTNPGSPDIFAIVSLAGD